MSNKRQEVVSCSTSLNQIVRTVNFRFGIMKSNFVQLIARFVDSRSSAGGWIFPALFAAVAASCLCACKKAAPPPPPPPIVQVVGVVAENAPSSAEFIGQLDSPQNVEVRARVEAFVDKIIFTEGTEVKEGDPLFKLDDKPNQERLAAANGMLAEAKAALNKYAKDVARLSPLAEKRAVPQQDLDNAVASVDVGKAGVLPAQARVESATLDVGYCDVHAPISGL